MPRVDHENHALNALRAAAAIMVAIVHARAFLMQSRQDFDPSALTQVAYLLTSFGHGAVLIFFVLSGYFVGGSVISGMRRDRFDAVAYAVSRLTRLWIVLLPALALTVVADWVGRQIAPGYYFYDEPPARLVDVVGGALFLQGSYTGMPGTNDALWSLAYEAFYYAMFPLILIGVIRGSGLRRLLAAVAAAVLLVFPTPLIWLLFPVWLMGAAVAYWREPIEATVRSWTPGRLALARVVAVGLVGVGLLLDRLMSVGFDSASPGSFVLGVFTAMLVALLLPDLAPRSAVLRGALMGLSRYAHSSYSLYAIHMPLLALTVALVNPATDRTSLWLPSPLTWLDLAVVVAALVVAGWFFAAVTERHTDTVRRAILARVRQRALSRT